MASTHPDLIIYCTKALHSGFSEDEILKRLTAAGHDRYAVQEALYIAKEQIQRYAPDQRQGVFPMQAVGLTIVLFVLIMGTWTVFHTPGITGYAVGGSLDCAGIALDDVEVQEHPGVCTITMHDITTVQVMLQNKGKTFNRYSVILNGATGFDHYDYEQVIDDNALITKIFDFDTSVNGKFSSVRVIPYVNNTQCPAIIINPDPCIS